MHYGIISPHADKYDIQQERWRVTTLAYLYEWPLRFPVEPKQEGASLGARGPTGQDAGDQPTVHPRRFPITNPFPTAPRPGKGGPEAASRRDG